jgi:hypothetical protein
MGAASGVAISITTFVIAGMLLFLFGLAGKVNEMLYLLMSVRLFDGVLDWVIAVYMRLCVKANEALTIWKGE